MEIEQYELQYRNDTNNWHVHAPSIAPLKDETEEDFVARCGHLIVKIHRACPESRQWRLVHNNVVMGEWDFETRTEIRLLFSQWQAQCESMEELLEFMRNELVEMKKKQATLRAAIENL